LIAGRSMAQREKKYQLISSYLRSFIDEHKFTDTNKMPSEHFLCRKFNVSRQTVRTAISCLERDGFVYTQRGSGTFFNVHYSIHNSSLPETEGKKVAIIVQGQDKNAISKILEGVRHTFKDSEIELRIFFTENKILNERRCLAACSSGFDALIIDGVKASTDSPNADIYEKLYKDNIPIIFYNNYHRDSKFPKVIVDDESCAQELVYQLVSNGHKYIGGLFIYDNYQGNKKYNGIIKSLIKYNVYVDDSYFKCCMLDDLRDSKQFKKMLWNFIKTIPKCTAIVCCNYMILEMLMEVLEIHNKQIPKDYSVVSFDYSADDWKQRNITTSIHPSFEMGVKLAQSVITMLENPSYNSQDVSYKFPPQIHIGASIKKIGPLP